MTANNGMRLVHPGEILRDELQALWLSANALSKALDAPVNRITATLHGQRAWLPTRQSGWRAILGRRRRSG